MLQSPEAMAQLGINPEMLQVCMHAYAIAHARATCTGHMHMPHATRHMHMRACMHITCHTPHTHATRLMRMHMLHTQAMMGGLAGGGGGGGGMMQIEVTPEDEEAISRLMSLGFPRGAAIQARLVTMQCIMQRLQWVHGVSHALPCRPLLACATALHPALLTAGLHGVRQGREPRGQLPLRPRERPRVKPVPLRRGRVGWSGDGRMGWGVGGRQAGGGGVGGGGCCSFESAVNSIVYRTPMSNRRLSFCCFVVRVCV
jgi:hypothetical protein